MNIIKQSFTSAEETSIVSIQDKVLPYGAKIRQFSNTKINKNIPRKLILKSFQSPGDTLMLTAAIRDLHRTYPKIFLTDVRTFQLDIWKNNPYITKLSNDDPSVVQIDCEYNLIHSSNQLPYHFIHGFRMDLEKKLGIKISAGEFRGEVYLSQEEKEETSLLDKYGITGDFWIVIPGGKYDYTAKWPYPDYLQEVINYFQNKITFVSCGHKDDFHPNLKNVIDLRGKTSIRDFIKLMYHAYGVLCPVTFAMHLAAAVETKPGRPKNRACVVIAGGREPVQWEQYPHHRYLSMNGCMDCCNDGGCWKDRATLINDDDTHKNDNSCVYPIEINTKEDIDSSKFLGSLKIAKCITMITPSDIIRSINMYYQHFSDVSIEPCSTYNVARSSFTTNISESLKDHKILYSVLLCCYGDYSHYSIRAINSVLNNKNRNFEFYVGCNECNVNTIEYVRNNDKDIDLLVQSNKNINKDPIMRILLEKVNTPYILWLDDDSHFTNENWSEYIKSFIEKNHSFECAGHIFYIGKSREYKDFLSRRSWYNEKQNNNNTVNFATGGIFLARTNFLLQNDFPDRKMIKRSDDLLLGDLVKSRGAKLISFDENIMKSIKISDGNRRGTGESKDGWL